MSTVISTDGQQSWKNSYASSPDARLSLRVNGEEKGVVIQPTGTVVAAGFDAPTVAPVATDSGSGNVPAGVYYYAYVYASSQYPFAESTITADGLLYPRSNPSSFAAVTVSGASTVAVVVGTSQRGDVDTIFVYRTPTAADAATALAYSNAGTLYYVGSLDNDPTVATLTFTDDSASDTGEALELDNFPCPLFRFTVCDGKYWWGFGNTDLVLTVSVNSTEVITIEGDGEWFSGRNGLKAHITGVDTGGFDGKGTFYFKATGQTTAEFYDNEELTGTPETIPATGTATLHIYAFSSTLYRSKALNPLAWGRTTQIFINEGADVINVSDLWAEPVGGGNGTGISLIPNERILKLDTEGPQKSYALDITAADSDQFMATLRTLDEAQSVSSQFSQFPMRLPGGQSVATGINAKSLQILSSDATSQIPIGGNVIRTLRRMQQGDSAAHFFHGVYDDALELNCWFVKTTEADMLCDTLIFQHAPTGAWGIKYWPWLSASATIFDPDTGRNWTLFGDEFGRIGFGLTNNAFEFRDWTSIVVSTDTVDQVSSTLTVTVPTLASITSIVSASGVSTVVTGAAHGLSIGQEVFIGGTTGSGDLTLGNVVVTFITSSTIFGFTAQHTGSYTESEGGISKPFMEIPGVVIRSGIRYVTAFDEVADATYTALTSTMEVEFFEQKGINIDTGEYEFISDGTDYYWLPAGTACSTRRHFNAPTLSQTKRLTEIWATQLIEGDFVNRWTILVGYANTLATDKYLTNTLTPKWDTNTDSYYYKDPPNDPTRAFGLDISEYGYDAYTLCNFTIKMHSS